MNDWARSLVNRAVAVTILAMLMGLVYLIFLEPIRVAHRNFDEEFSRTRNLLHKYQQLGSAQENLNLQLSNLNNAMSETALVLSGADQAIVGANLQAWVKSVTLENGGKLESLQIVFDNAVENFRVISARVRFQGSMEALQKIIFNIERFPPLRVIESLTISQQRKRRRRNDIGESRLLSVRLEISAIMKDENS